MTTEWVLVLEVVRRPTASPVDGELLQRLLKLLSEAEPERAQPVALHAEDRYALHFTVTADNIPDAVMTAVCRWENVTSRLGLVGWDPRRAEIITREDFDEEAQTLVDDSWGLGEPCAHCRGRGSAHEARGDGSWHGAEPGARASIASDGRDNTARRRTGSCATRSYGNGRGRKRGSGATPDPPVG